jgi:membrane dipeptidase
MRWLLPMLLFLGVLAVSTLAQEPAAPRGEVKLTEEALKIHRDALLIDGHNDLPWKYREKKDPGLDHLDITKNVPDLHTDIPRLRKGNVGAQFWSAYVDAHRAKDLTAVRCTLEQIDIILRMIKKYPGTFEQAFTADDIERIHKAGKIASLIGVEGGHSIDNSLGVLRIYYGLGVRYMTLTHSETLDWADSATDQPKSHGLSPFGEQVVLEMNRLGMLVDISHVSAETMRHVLRITRAPVIASHSSALAIAQHPRNVPDDVLQQMPRNGGVIMVNFFPGFIVPEAVRISKDVFSVARKLRECYPDDQQFRPAMEAWMKDHPMPRGSVRTVVDHIEHIIKTAGIDHVGIGSDFDGISLTPVQLEDVSCYPYITQELLNRGYQRDAILKILGGNLLRVLRGAEQTARNMKDQPVITAVGPAKNP